MRVPNLWIGYSRVHVMCGFDCLFYLVYSCSSPTLPKMIIAFWDFTSEYFGESTHAICRADRFASAPVAMQPHLQTANVWLGSVILTLRTRLCMMSHVSQCNTVQLLWLIVDQSGRVRGGVRRSRSGSGVDCRADDRLGY